MAGIKSSGLDRLLDFFFPFSLFFLSFCVLLRPRYEVTRGLEQRKDMFSHMFNKIPLGAWLRTN